jgi:hypothetical protein
LGCLVSAIVRKRHEHGPFRPANAASYPIPLAGLFPTCCTVSAREVWDASKFRLKGIACTVHSQVRRTMLTLSEESACVLTEPPSLFHSVQTASKVSAPLSDIWAGVNWIT